MPKAAILSDPTIAELSLIFGTHKGTEWAPRNSQAIVLGMKGAPASQSFLDRLVSAFKSKGYLVKDDAPDNVDGDGDGATDYEQLAKLVTGVTYDMNAAYGISDPDARSIATTTALDNFKKNLDDVYSGGDGTAAWKAGARHSKADAAHIDAIGAAATTMAEASAQLNDASQEIAGHVAALSSKPAQKDVDGDDTAKGDDETDSKKASPSGWVAKGLTEDGLPENYADLI
jgi:hypothetical protein